MRELAPATNPEAPVFPVFRELDLWDDAPPREAPLQMAVDEALLESLQRPLLRHYRWAGRVASFGISQSASTVARALPGFQLVRRWTGGGIVRHDNDWTFSLLVPRCETFARLRPTASYAMLHQIIARALARSGWVPQLADVDDCRASAACFTGPSLHDILLEDGSKICGGAQRRTRCGLLHQGSIQGVPLSGRFARSLASALSDSVVMFASNPEIESRAAALADTKYGTLPWHTRIV